MQDISCHRNLEQLQKYLEATNEQVLGATSGKLLLNALFTPWILPSLALLLIWVLFSGNYAKHSYV
ncbi:hypothetical protein [Nostoc sp. CALU 1950]|uniref:hypothetical protein n=1 Tax=Nostoc sp. CALU 1950 TaxID=3104321 RepID=UPI003EBD1AFC